MPNIEIHGLGTEKQADDMEDRIFWEFSDKLYVDEMVVTVYPTRPRDKKKKVRPFLRLVNSCQDHTEEILRILQTLGIDVEHATLNKFYPKKEVRNRC